MVQFDPSTFILISNEEAKALVCAARLVYVTLLHELGSRFAFSLIILSQGGLGGTSLLFFKLWFCSSGIYRLLFSEVVREQIWRADIFSLLFCQMSAL